MCWAFILNVYAASSCKKHWNFGEFVVGIATTKSNNSLQMILDLDSMTGGSTTCTSYIRVFIFCAIMQNSVSLQNYIRRFCFLLRILTFLCYSYENVGLDDHFTPRHIQIMKFVLVPNNNNAHLPNNTLKIF